MAAIVRGLATPNGTYAEESYIVAGGLQSSGPTDNVWLGQSASGATWQVQSSAAPFPNNLVGHAIAVLPFVPHSVMDAAAVNGVYYAGNSTIVIAGGNSLGYSGLNNDVWVSSDLGCSWQHYTAPWSPRWGSSLVFFGSQLSLKANGSFFSANDSLLLIGGEDASGQDNDEDWLSFDSGITWQLIDSTSLPSIAFFGLAVSDYQLAEYGGFATFGGHEYPSGFVASLPFSFLSTPTPVSSSSAPPSLSSSSSAPGGASSSSSSAAPVSVSSSSSSSPSVSAPSSSSTATPSASSSSSRTGATVPTGPAGVIGDPQFVGLLGQSFQVHGIDGAVYSLIIDRGVLVNARFRYLSSGRCPQAASHASNCWSHPGSYLGEVGVVSEDGNRLHVVSGDWSTGFDRVTLDGAVLSVLSNTTRAGLDVQMLSAFELRVRVGNWELLLHNSDRFVNVVETRVLHWPKLSASGGSHGLLGQTWHMPREGKRDGQVQYIEGDVDEYVEQNNDILGGAFLYGVVDNATDVGESVTARSGHAE